MNPAKISTHTITAKAVRAFGEGGWRLSIRYHTNSHIYIYPILLWQEIREKIPNDPLEAELLMMAEAVAGGDEDSDSDTDIEMEATETAAQSMSLNTSNIYIVPLFLAPQQSKTQLRALFVHCPFVCLHVCSTPFAFAVGSGQNKSCLW